MAPDGADRVVYMDPHLKVILGFVPSTLKPVWRMVIAHELRDGSICRVECAKCKQMNPPKDPNRRSEQLASLVLLESRKRVRLS